MPEQSASTRQGLSFEFLAMASPCIVIADDDDSGTVQRVGEIVKAEALRIESKYSRFQPSLVTQINGSAGIPFEVDTETADLLDYAALCHKLSNGRFDITSGVLRRVWTFSEKTAIPSEAQIREILGFVGWHRVRWERPILQLEAGMEIDLGGIGKEYAVDRALSLAAQQTSVPLMVNFGGDLRVSGPRTGGAPWHVAIEDASRKGRASGILELSHGALATSGDTYRSFVHNGIRYSHVLDPLTGWPVRDAPRTVTVHADTCSEAGLLAKLALLRGADAEEFILSEQIQAWCSR